MDRNTGHLTWIEFTEANQTLATKNIKRLVSAKLVTSTLSYDPSWDLQSPVENESGVRILDVDAIWLVLKAYGAN